MVRGRWTLATGHKSAQLITDVDNSCLWGFSPLPSATLPHAICTGKTSVHSVRLKLCQKNLLLFQSFFFWTQQTYNVWANKGLGFFSFFFLYVYLLDLNYPQKRHWSGSRYAGGFISPKQRFHVAKTVINLATLLAVPLMTRAVFSCVRYSIWWKGFAGPLRTGILNNSRDNN